MPNCDRAFLGGVIVGILIAVVIFVLDGKAF